MNTDTPKADGAGCDARPFNDEATPTSDPSGLLVCVDAAEARLMRRAGRRCITSPKLRNLLMHILETRAENAAREAVAAVRRLSGVSSADDPGRWTMWDDCEGHIPGIGEVRAALQALPSVPTAMRDPENLTVLGPLQLWNCQGTTVLVARDTVELVRAADTYAKADCYRPHGRMDDPFTPQPGRVCLVTVDELRLVRLPDGEDVTLLLTFSSLPDGTPKDDGAGCDAPHPSRFPTAVRAMCGERPELRVVLAAGLAGGRPGYPFFLGLTRGVGFEALAEADNRCPAALAWRIQTNDRPEPVRLRVVVWAGGDNVRALVRYGGLSIFTGRATRRKVQLRSLGLVRSGTVAGAPIYDLGRNYDTLSRWAVTRTFAKPDASHRERDRRRVRCGKALPQSARGTSIIHNTSPWRIQVTPSSAGRKAASALRNLQVGELRGVTTVRLRTLQAGGVYLLNARAKVGKDGEAEVDQKRCMIRCPLFRPEDEAGMLAWLAGEPHVVMSGTDERGGVFALVRVANGTEDQQREAVARWADSAGRMFPHATGAGSWVPGSAAFDSPTHIREIRNTNWRAESLQTAQFERYVSGGDYAKPVKLKRYGVATLSERAKAYADTVPLADEGTRNQSLAVALLRMRELFGREATEEALPAMLARSTLPEREKRKLVRRVLRGEVIEKRKRQCRLNLPTSNGGSAAAG